MMAQFCEDDAILTQGSAKREMYKILSGKAAVYFNYGMPEEYLIGVLWEQRCFGELSILCGKPSAYSVVAIGIMRNLARTVDTLSLNLNMVNEDLATMISAKDITLQIRQHVAMDTIQKALFSALI